MVSFNFSFDPNVSFDQRSVFEAAGLLWSQFLEDDMSVNLHVKMDDDMPSNILGGAVPGLFADQTYGTIQSALTDDATSGIDQQTINTLNQATDGQYTALLENTNAVGDQLSLTRANAKALGLTDAHGQELDGYIVINSLSRSDLDWSYDYTQLSPADENTVDLVSVALHEIGHVLGFTSGLDLVSFDLGLGTIDDSWVRLTNTTILDLFRYSEQSAAEGALDLSLGNESYFSLDGGRTNIAPFSGGQVVTSEGVRGYQASHWRTELGGAESLATNISNYQFEVQDNTGTQATFVATGVQLSDTPAQNSIGVMDPSLAPGERNGISWFDLLAMDSIGYSPTAYAKLYLDLEIVDTSSILLDFNQLITQLSTDEATIFGVKLSELETEGAIERAYGNLISEVTNNTIQHTIADFSDQVETMVEQSLLYERRRSRRRRSRSSFFQENDQAPSEAALSQPSVDLLQNWEQMLQGGIQGQVRYDWDQDGNLTDREAGIEGVSISLFSDFDKDGREDGVPLATVVTDSNGRYSFEDLAQGRYIVVQKDLDGFVSTADSNGYDPNRIAFIDVFDTNVTNQDFLDAAEISPFNDDQDNRDDDQENRDDRDDDDAQNAQNDVDDAQRREGDSDDGQNGQDATADNGGNDTDGSENSENGFSIPSQSDEASLGRIRGQVRFDIDRDGDLTDLDEGVAGVRIRLFADFDNNGGEDGGAIATVLTGDNGQYSFEDLAQGRYIVVAEDLEGFFSTADRNGYNPNRIAFIDVYNRTITDQDFLDASVFTPSLPTEPRAQGVIQGQVRHDVDEDGDLEDLDRGLVGAKIQLFSDFDLDGQEDGDAIATTQTNGQGEYGFENLTDGFYIVQAEDLNGFFSTGDRNGYNPNRIAYLNVYSNDAVLTGQDFLDATFEGVG